MAAEKIEGVVVEFLRDKISNYFSEKLLRITRDILHHFKRNKGVETNEHRKSESEAQRGDAALEFINHVYAVLSVDQKVLHEVNRLRKNVLKLIHVKEFAPEAQLKNLSTTFFLPNVICSYCNDCRDLDLLRDPALQGPEWRCAAPHCGQLYDREEMENSLLQVVRQRERLYHLQDLQCVKCRQVKNAHLSDQCTCGGTFRCTENPSDFLWKMKVFSQIASQQKFQLLGDCVSWILEA